MARGPNILIIGGGLMGCACGWQLAQAGADVLILERSVPGAEASSAAAGILGAQVESHPNRAMAELSRMSRDRYGAWAEALKATTGLDIEYRLSGALRVGREASQLEELRREYSEQLSSAESARLINPAELKQLEPNLTRELEFGVEFPLDARVDPRALFKAVQLAALSSGVKFRSGQYVEELLVETSEGAPRATGVRLAGNHELKADWVVVAAGSWTTLIPGVPLPRPSIQPARGQILELRAQRPLFKHVIFGPDCYLVPRDDGRVLVGSTLEFVGYEKRVTAQAVRDLLTRAIALVPALGQAELSDSWCNFRPYTPDHLPILGGSADIAGLVFATGHYRNGILLAPITAEIVAAHIFQRSLALSMDPFSPGRETIRSAHGLSEQTS